MPDIVSKQYAPTWGTPTVRVERWYSDRYVSLTSPLLQMFPKGLVLEPAELLDFAESFKRAHAEVTEALKAHYKSYSATVSDKHGSTYYTVTVDEGDTMVKIDRPAFVSPFMPAAVADDLADAIHEARAVAEYNAQVEAQR